MDIEYSFTRPIPPDELHRLFALTNWTNTRTTADIQSILANSVCVGAWQGNELVGFARAITDDLTRAFIEDVIVAEDRRGRGIGLALMRALLGRLSHVQEILLDCEAGLVGYYAQVGFTKNDNNHLHIWKGFDWAH